MNADSADARPVDVQRTLQYESHVFTRKLIWMPIVCLAVGLWVMLYGSVHDKMQWQPWVGLVLGAGWLLYAFYRLAVPAPPMLVLSPEGMTWRNGLRRPISWQLIKDVTGGDHEVWFRGTRQTFENVTIVWVSRRYYNQKIFVPSLLWRGPFWNNVFIHKQDVTGIVIAPEMVSAEPAALRAEITARWRAFGQPRAAVQAAAGSAKPAAARTSVPSTHENDEKRGPVELADVAETRTVQYWLNWLVIAVVPLFVSGAIYVIVSSYYPSKETHWAQSEAEWAERERLAKQLFEPPKRDDESRLAWREQSPFMFADDDSFTEPGTTPPQRPGSTRGHRGAAMSLAVVDDSRFLSASDDGTIKLWLMQNKTPLRDVGLHGGGARAVRLLPGGSQVLSGGDDGQIVVRALADGKVLHRLNGREHGGVRSLALSADGRRALTLHGKGDLVVWDLETKTRGKVLKETGAFTVAMSKDGATAAIGNYDGKLLVWAIDGTDPPRQIAFHEQGVYAVAIMPDGKHVVSGGGGDYVLRVRNLATGQEVRSLPGHKAVTYTLVVSDDGTRLVSGSHDNTARLWNAETGEEITRLDQSNTVRAALFVGDGGILTAGDDRTIRLWSKHGFREREFPGVSEK